MFLIFTYWVKVVDSLPLLTLSVVTAVYHFLTIDRHRSDGSCQLIFDGPLQLSQICRFYLNKLAVNNINLRNFEFN